LVVLYGSIINPIIRENLRESNNLLLIRETFRTRNSKRRDASNFFKKAGSEESYAG